MSSYYGQLFPEFWDGPTGRAIQRTGGKDATIVAAFLFSNRRANMIGLYRISVEDIHNSTPVKGQAAIAKALDVLDAVNFAHFDAATEFVWVREMARIRVGLRNRSESLEPKDKRVTAANTLYKNVDENPFLAGFFVRYAETLHLKRQRTSEHHPKMTPLERDTQAPSKPVNRNSNRNRQQGTAAGTAETDQGKPPALTRRESRTTLKAAEVRTTTLLKLIHAIRGEHPDWLRGDVRAEARQRAEASSLTYNADAVANAVDVAFDQAERIPA